MLERPEYRLSGLTQTEMNVLRLVCQGYNNGAIARELHFNSRKYVETVLSSIYRKYGTNSPDLDPRVALVLKCLRQEGE